LYGKLRPVDPRWRAIGTRKNGDSCAGAYNSRNDCAPYGRMAPDAARDIALSGTDAPYEESRRKPASWNHRREFAPNRHGFRAPDGSLVPDARTPGR